MDKKNILRLIFTVFLAVSIILASSSCSLLSGMGGDESSQAGETTEEVEVSETTEEPLQEDITVKVWVDDAIPAEPAEILIRYIGQSPDLEQAMDSQDAEVKLEIVPAGGIDSGEATVKQLDVTYVMAPVTSFFNINDSIQWEDFRAWWDGDDSAAAYISGQVPAVLLVEQDTYDLLVSILGESGNEDIEITDSAAISGGINDGSLAFSIIPFNHIEKQMKVLEVNELSVFNRRMDLGDFPFAFSVMLEGIDEASTSRAYEAMNDISYTNRDLESMTSLIMTGVTAMVRGTALRMENNGVNYPGEKIADILIDADITHISNEVPFVDGCDVLTDNFPVFCSKPEYIGLLEYVGTDVVELTGNHMNDHGHEWFLYTLDMYDDMGLPYYGGGRDLEDAYSPAILESNGNKFAFLGLNWWGPATDWATADTPGSAPPNFEDFEEIIKELKDEGYIVIFTFQYLESYQYDPVPQQVIDFRRMADAGADIVSGSQSHQPQGMEFYNDGFITYGLGNLFFDQMWDIGTRQELIVKHIFYNGKHINTIIITAMLEDYSQPRLTTPQEREELLTEVFNASIR